MLDRRSFMKLALAAQAAAALPAFAGTPTPGLRFGDPQPFSFDWLKAHAEALSKAPYAPPPRPDPATVAAIDYDAHGKLKYRQEYALYGDGHDAAFPITFQHVGYYFPKTVRMHALEPNAGGAVSREIIYDPAYFTIAPDSPAARLAPEPSSFAGFWVMEPRDGKEDWKKAEPWVTFLGASYFRAKGELGQVGMSARGIALSPGGSGHEEFPDFVSFWFSPAPPASRTVTVYALLNSPSVSGAYKFDLHRTSGVVMDIELTLFFREAVERLGLAPLTSMFWYGEKAKPAGIDWRPEVHDSDGLSLATGQGERIWRPLNNPSHITISSFADEHPRGFGLLQRDRVFDHYQDGVGYEKRPSTWVEPKGNGWGKGTVQLVEIPTDDEINDNIVVYWNPEKRPEPGDRIDLAYRIHWLADEPYPTPLARCVATRFGRGGEPGTVRPYGVRKFTVEFLGGPLKDLPNGVKPEVVVWASRGNIRSTVAEAVPDDVPGHWRTHFDLSVDGREPVELRLYLRAGDKVLSETWLYQYHPFVTDARPLGY
ncbi:glucan biosynthesis protein [Rhodomicrobium lacus]|uniref:glucan biosynthesis protein n=1 Tax=Rhodomicrobium lacus TaxID=2498452 RepID=UPI0026E460A7|nr:glucan biosynthesis protein D [Rhodomicrobium lacus]WKW51205.1 glucan biosynthesis protein D [Rhodomicrobium lacus]